MSGPYFPVIDLSQVPAPDVVEALDYEAIFAAMRADFVARDPSFTALLDSDPAIKVLQAAAYREMLLRQRVNDAARAVLLTQASRNDLDNIGALFGVARLTGETDERYRLRVQQGLALLAGAGPHNAYRAHAMAVSGAIVDVGVHSPEAGVVHVVVLAPQDVARADQAGDDLAIGAALFAQPTDQSRAAILIRSSTPLMDQIRVRLNSDDYRPLTDSVVVRPPDPVTFAVSAQLVLYPGPDAATVRAAALARLATYLASVRRVAYDVTRSGIIAALTAPGVQNVLLAGPSADVVVGPTGVAVCTSKTVTADLVDV
jgi:phage-related baseplate assembly protein